MSRTGQERNLQNEIIFNLAQTNEIVFHRPHPSVLYVVPSFSNIGLELVMMRNFWELGLYVSSNNIYHLNSVQITFQHAVLSVFIC
jgi:hypothetical protein